MARKHYWQFLVTDEGNPIENASISIFEAGTEDPVYIFTDELGNTGNASAPQVNTSKKGFFEFWIADNNENNGYPIATKFKIAWSAPGVSSGFIDYVEVFSTAVQPVTIGDLNSNPNKAVSNALATGWEYHKDWDISLDGPIHGIGAIDSEDTDQTLTKLVSNWYAKRWTDHESTDYTGFTNQLNPPTNPHGIAGTDAVFDGIVVDSALNILVSNDLANRWQNHVINASEDHLQYSLLDGTRFYTLPVGYDGTVTYAALAGDDFVTKGMNEGFQYSIDITDLDIGWTLDGSLYYIEIVHGKGIDVATPPIIQVWDTTTDRVVLPTGIQNLDTNRVRLEMTVASNIFVMMQW